MSFEDSLASELAILGVADEVEGCTDADLAQTMNAQSVPTLPTAYVSFLRAVGRHDAGLFETGDGTYYLFPGLLDFRDVAQRITRHLRRERSFSDVAGEDAFVFAHYLDEQALFFRVTQGEDPPILRIHEARDSPELISPTFSSFIRDILANRHEC
jgi:hypothetical protein